MKRNNFLDLVKKIGTTRIEIDVLKLWKSIRLPLGIFIWFLILWIDLCNQHIFFSSVLLMQSFLIVLTAILCVSSTVLIISAKSRSFGLKSMKILGLVCFYLISTLVVSGMIWHYWTVNSKATGEHIVEAIDRFYEQNGRYPEDLDKLVPEYIDSIPLTDNPLFKQSYVYSLREDEFILEFDAGAMIKCRFNEKPLGRKWFCCD